MFKKRLIAASIAALVSAGPVLAGNVSSSTSAAIGAMTEQTLSPSERIYGFPGCYGLNCSYLIRCDGTDPGFGVAMADGFNPGDIWRGNLLSPRAPNIASASNMDAWGNALPADTFGPEAVIDNKSLTSYVTINAGNGIPGGLPASGYVKVRGIHGQFIRCKALAASPYDSPPDLD